MHTGQLFSEHFLADGIRITDAYQRLTAQEPSFAADLGSKLKEIFGQFPIAGAPSEPQTEQDLIFRVLEALGWHRDIWAVQPRTARKGRSDVPDMLLFADEASKSAANAEVAKEKWFRHGVAIVESKRWDRPLDRARGSLTRSQGPRPGKPRQNPPLRP